jgi:AraC-like DNA-binding protein
MSLGAVNSTVIKTSCVDPPRRLDYWRDMISSTFVALDCDAPKRREFSGSLETSALKDVQFSTVVSDAQHVVRSRRRIRQAPDDCFLVSIQCRGMGYVTQEDRVAELGVGDFAIYDASQPYELRFREPFEQLVLRLPRHYFSHRIACPERLTATAFRSSQGPVSIVSNFVSHLYRQLHRLDFACTAAVHQALVDLLIAALAGTSTRGMFTSNQLVMRQRIKSFVETHLCNPGLNCTLVSQAHGISVRYLNKLFENDEVSLSEWMWARRLDRARVSIESSHATGQAITQIAYDWGFKDPAHFSRAFKARYGESPSAYQRGSEIVKR